MATAIGTARMKKINHFCPPIKKGDEALTTGLKTSSEGSGEGSFDALGVGEGVGTGLEAFEVG